MVEEVMRNIYRIPVPLPNNPLRELNAYYIRGGERDLLIDTGFNQDECRSALKEGIRQLKSDAKELDVLVTHMHFDHIGLAPEMVSEGGHLYISAVDGRLMVKESSDLAWQERDQVFYEEGFSKEELAELASKNPARVLGPAWEKPFVFLSDGETLTVGDYQLHTLIVPGHTPGNACYWLEEQRTMFTGDHVLFDITPNITSWPGVADSLGDYLDSLRRVREYPVERALPAHRAPGDFHARVDHLLAHHDYRIGEALKVVQETQGLTAYEIAGQMTWKIRARNWAQFPVIQKWFAVGEGMAHLDYLCLRGQVVRKLGRDSRYRYYPG